MDILIVIIKKLIKKEMNFSIFLNNDPVMHNLIIVSVTLRKVDGSKDSTHKVGQSV